LLEENNRVGAVRTAQPTKTARILYTRYGYYSFRLFLVFKPEGKRPLERPRHRWEGDIIMELREIG
jgi:hypothetical protein